MKTLTLELKIVMDIDESGLVVKSCIIDKKLSETNPFDFGIFLDLTSDASEFDDYKEEK